MTKKQVPSAQKLTKSALTVPSRIPRRKAAEYRQCILILLAKNFSHEEIADFLREEGVKIGQTTISRYLRNHPPTEEEECEIARLLESRRGMEPTPHKHSTGARTRSRRPQSEEADDTDYSFLNVQGRPFTIREDDD